MSVVRACRRLVASSRFDAAMLVVILLNAIVLGAETYPSLDQRHGTLLHTLNDVFLGVFVVELAIRLTAAAPRLRDFWRNPWNVFDFIVIVGSFLPGLRENATLLRVLRLARVVRVVRFLPELRVVISAVARAIPGVASLAAATLLLVYLYAMVGWLIFDTHDPENFGTVGRAMITMFVLLTLENLPTYIDKGEELSDWTVLFFVSYVLTASFVVFNLFIGIVLNSMEGARNEEAVRERDRERRAAAATTSTADDARVAVEDRIDELRESLAALEDELRRQREAPAT